MKRKLKICSPQLGLDPNSDLGGEVHDHFVLQGLAKRGHKIFVYLPKEKPYQKHRNIIVARAPIKHIPALLFNFLVIPYLFTTYKKEKFDILRVHSPYFVGLGALLFKLFHPSVPIVTTYHLTEDNLIFNLINFLTAKRYDKILTVSRYIRKWLIEKYDIPKEKVEVIYNGVSPDLIPKSKNERLLRKYSLKNKFILLFMGLLIDRKNPMFLLEVFKSLKSKYSNIALIICGRGPLEKTINDFVIKFNLKDVILTGRIMPDQKSDYLNLCDIFVLPSKNEGFGLVIEEAMACAKPVVITNAWTASEAVKDGTNGILCNLVLNEWVKKIGFLVEKPDLLRKMGDNALAKARSDFQWSISISKREKLFMDLLKWE